MIEKAKKPGYGLFNISGRRAIILIVLLGINLFIFINRNNGFDYKDYADSKELNYNCDSQCLTTWTNHCYNFSEEEQLTARNILRNEIGLDTITSDINKVIAINIFLYNSICKGNRNLSWTKPDNKPLQIFSIAKEQTGLNILCGRASLVNYLFCTSAGLSVRPIQVIQNAGLNLLPDSHVFNEVWIKEAGKWCFTDFYRNRILIYLKNHPLASSEYYDLLNQKAIISHLELSIDSSGNFIELNKDAPLQDKYLNPDYYLAYFKNCDPSEVYSLRNKLRHYLLPVSHFKIYASTVNEFRDNALFYLKEFFVLSLFLYFLYVLIIKSSS